MTNVETVSAKIPREKKKRLKELGINTTELIRRAVDKEIAEREWELIRRDLEEARPILTKVSREGWQKAIRESRDER